MVTRKYFLLFLLYVLHASFWNIRRGAANWPMLANQKSLYISACMYVHVCVRTNICVDVVEYLLWRIVKGEWTVLVIKLESAWQATWKCCTKEKHTHTNTLTPMYSIGCWPCGEAELWKAMGPACKSWCAIKMKKRILLHLTSTGPNHLQHRQYSTHF